ncbi:Leucine aminopeptidase 2 [Hibiscus syriacus]|uniref:Leucine aminopeptidase 2 n=1 Tax=Hibiscus syriacus TaxID=106335 RepID=A0A6A2XSS8_HIBSY|nr:Leucine aminopeptidase 2 [Hibiscus syriacus]
MVVCCREAWDRGVYGEDSWGLLIEEFGRGTFGRLGLRRSVRRQSEEELGFPNPSSTVQFGPGSDGNTSRPVQISFAAKEIDVAEWKGDLLAVGVTVKDMIKDETSKFQNSLLKKLDGLLRGFLGKASSEEDFTGKTGQSMVHRLPGLGFKRLQRLLKPVVLASSLPSSEGLSTESKSNTTSALASGTVLGTCDDNRYKSESKKPLLKSVDIIGLGTGPETEKKLKYAEVVSYAMLFGRELVNSLANVLSPAALAAEASKIASKNSDVLSANILTEEQCRELKMGSYLGGFAASANPPHFIHLCYKPLNGPTKTKLALVGKGLTFDSGGYNIKTGPGCSIETMEVDMGGSAAVFGAAKALGQIKPPGVEVHFIVASCENMISGTGMRPGYIVTASNGKTIEVNNTDAEGRLTLADDLVYSCNQGVEKIVDLATLTGACVVALGPSISGVFTPSDDLAKEVLEASEVSGEKFWRMPLEESYWESMKSGVADMLNTSGRQGGAINAALFLKQVVDEKVQWLHIDMAGPVLNDKKHVATGLGISNLAEWVLKKLFLNGFGPCRAKKENNLFEAVGFLKICFMNKKHVTRKGGGVV